MCWYFGFPERLGRFADVRKQVAELADTVVPLPQVDEPQHAAAKELKIRRRKELEEDLPVSFASLLPCPHLLKLRIGEACHVVDSQEQFRPADQPSGCVKAGPTS